jgi:hypothetical protein
MKALLGCLGALLLAAVATAGAYAQGYSYPPYYYPYAPQAPAAFGQGFYCPDASGMAYGSSSWSQPPLQPFNGVQPDPGCFCCPKKCGPQYYSNPFVRGPRDYFMLDP